MNEAKRAEGWGGGGGGEEVVLWANLVYSKLVQQKTWWFLSERNVRRQLNLCSALFSAPISWSRVLLHQ